MVWTRFFDMYSGGIRNTEYETIYIELPEKEAIKYFELEFGIDPLNTNCDCCGSNYSIKSQNNCNNNYDDKPIKIITINEIKNNKKWKC